MSPPGRPKGESLSAQREGSPATSVPDPAAAVERAEDTPYARLGGEVAVRALVDRFYDLMVLEPGYAQLRAVHGNDLTNARNKLYWFLCGWLGGPSLYIERFGHPRLRARHLPFAIGTVERDQWLECMNQAMVEQGVDEDLRLRLVQAFFQTADWMRNRPG